MKITKNDLVRFGKFLFFSLGAGIIQIGTFSILNGLLHIEDWWLSHLPALVLSVLFNFTLNKSYTFKSADNVPKCMFLVFLFYLVFTPASTFGGQALTVIGWDDFLAPRSDFQIRKHSEPTRTRVGSFLHAGKYVLPA